MSLPTITSAGVLTTIMLVLLLKHTYRQSQVIIHVILLITHQYIYLSLHLINCIHKTIKTDQNITLKSYFQLSCEILLHCLVKFLETAG